MDQPRIVNQEFVTDEAYFYAPIADAVDIEDGDLITFASSTAIVMAAANADATFIGVAAQQKESGDGQRTLKVCINPIVEIDVTSGTYVPGDELKWTSENTLVASGSADAIGRVWLLMDGGITGTETRLIARLITDKYWRSLSA